MKALKQPDSLFAPIFILLCLAMTLAWLVVAVAHGME